MGGDVFLHDRPVLFSYSFLSNRNIFFGSSAGTRYLTVEDFQNHPGQFKITEFRVAPEEPIESIVDTNKKYEEHLNKVYPVYVVEEVTEHIKPYSNYLKLEP